MKSKRVGRAIGALIFSVIRRRDVRWKKNVAKFKEGVAFSGIAKRCLLLGESEHLISSSASLFMDPKRTYRTNPALIHMSALKGKPLTGVSILSEVRYYGCQKKAIGGKRDGIWFVPRFSKIPGHERSRSLLAVLVHTQKSGIK
jgi:hypothetical protein